MIPLPALLTVGAKLIDKFFPDAQAAEQAKLNSSNQAKCGRLR